MADDPKKNPTQTPGQESEARREGEDIPKKNPFPQNKDKDEEQDDQRKGGQRRAS